ncbi:hypothetical protein W97_01781 [Coniosporium apollinis CBS 100218]|uniref:Glycylpeptide N-tetradecanoyltransferase n=1 Tax=Coniosporium apollinis (strain CBS 100218) TaxID=1168221 RepID=R7YKX0_CONA1|nr:uncharacterized protein W97_01781 [Coniosporium apollinis CBS 100218]EON62557.1 hypothetical protein W97_01781 [Coniosporium apollinis CBS 100218]
MPQEVSVPVDEQATEDAVKEALGQADPAGHDESSGDEAPADGASPDAVATEAAKKKKRKKRSKVKALAESILPAGSSSSTAEKPVRLTETQKQQLFALNPALKADYEEDPQKVEQMLSKLSIADILTGMAASQRNTKDMASHKFWQTQPVPKFEDAMKPVEEGPIKVIDPARVPKEAPPFAVQGFEWDTLDLTDEGQLQEVYELLTHHYVEDDEAMFRFNYSSSFLNWALKAPGWRKDWHIGVRATTSRRLVAFISGIPVSLRVRKNTLSCSEINFLCIHKKLRSKRLAPVLIQEVTRRCYVQGVYQAIYTAGILLPAPVSTCRYFHRSLNWEKLYEVGFSPLPAGSTKQRQIARYKLPKETETPGLRPMETKDVDAVLDLLKRYLSRMDMAQEFSSEEVAHWLVHDEKICPEQVVWSYVVEDANQGGKLTDFFSFYCLESTVIGNTKHPTIRAAYLFYYATETAFTGDQKALKERLNGLMHDALVLAKKANFDVFNALTLLHNPLFLEDQKFGAGDGQLNYYLYNYRANYIQGGVDPKTNKADESRMGGVGVVML